MKKFLRKENRNVHNRNKAISAFKADDLRVRVIMLGLESAASGTNLMEATHVILLGPRVP
jgi:SNF2 family DNA or RNA helicase